MNQIFKPALIFAVAFGLTTAITTQAHAITVEEIVTLVGLGIPEADIVKAIDKDRTVFSLQIGDILELKKVGVPDGVIQHMMRTQQLYGAPAATASTATTSSSGATAAPAPVVEVQKMKTPEELAAEAAAKAEEERRRAEEARKAEEARRSAYARGVLRDGLALAEQGKWVESLTVFQNFVRDGNYPPGSVEAYNANYGIAAALTNAGLYQSAAKMLVDVVLEGPDKPFFQEAFLALRKLRAEIIYNPPDLERLPDFSTVGFSSEFQDQYNYVLGEYFFDFNNFQRATKHLDAVPDSAADGPKARYLTALIQVRYKMYKSAVESLQRAIVAVEQQKGDSVIRDLGYMALARIAYEAGNYDAAIFYYKKVPQSSSKAGVVFYEMAWTYMMKGDYSRALGSFHTLHSPYFAETFFPELWILEARAYGDLCYPDRAKRALEMFERDVVSTQVPLRAFINAQKSPEDFYNNFVAAVNGEPSAMKLDDKLVYPVLSNIEFYNLYRTIRQIEKEDREFRANQGRLGSFGQEMLARLAMLKKESIVRGGIKVQQILTTLDADINEALVQQTEIEVDINMMAINQMTEETKRMVGEASEEEAEVVTSGKVAVVGDDTEVWPFEGEYWRDEISYYRSMLTSQCTDDSFF